MKKNKDSFLLYRSFIEAANSLDGERFKVFINALMNFALDGVVPDNLEPGEMALFTIAKPSMTAAKNRYIAAVENGKKGGRPPTSKNQNKNQSKTSSKPEANLTDTDTDTDTEAATDNEAVDASDTDDENDFQMNALGGLGGLGGREPIKTSIDEVDEELKKLKERKCPHCGSDDIIRGTDGFPLCFNCKKNL